MSLIPQAFHLIFRNAWVSIGKLSYIICRNTYFFTFVKTNHYVRRPAKKVPIITQAHKKDIMKSQRAKNVVRRLLMSIFFLECIGMTSVYSQVHEAIKPYVDFLSHKQLSAKDYILSLFKNHDIVFICERDHRDITQYELYLDILRDPYFTNHVGVLFTEVGSRSLNPELNQFLSSGKMDSTKVNSRILDFRRNMLFYPVWHCYNWSMLAQGIYQLNNTLPEEKKIAWYPSDIYFETKNPIDKEKIKKAYNQYNDYYQRDSLMADYIIRKINVMKSKNQKQKALIIMNYRHAFNPNYYRQKGVPEQNVGRFLFEAFPGQCTNVLVNQFALTAIHSDNDIAVAPTQQGKWDAAFHHLGINDAGFNFSGTPFGKDEFDHDPRTCPGITYQDVFTGFVYYRFIPEFRIVVGVPHIAEEGFADEYEKREAIYYEIHQTENPHEAQHDIWKLNEIEERSEDFLPNLMQPIQQWLK